MGGQEGIPLLGGPTITPDIAVAGGQPDLLLRVARVVTSPGPGVSVDVGIRVERGLIAELAPAAVFGSELLDVEPIAGTLLPGVVDTHAHVTLPADGAPLTSQLQASPDEALRIAASQLRKHLHSGVTTTLDCGATGTTSFAVRAAVESGVIEGPRLMVVGRPITRSGGHLRACGSVADGPEAIRREVRQLASEGADAIKIVASGGGTGGIPSRASYSVEELVAGVQAAHELGLRVTTHCRAAEAITNCIDAGVDVIGHVEFLWPGPLVDLGGGAPTTIPRFDERIGEQIAASSALLDFHPHSSGWDTVVRLRAMRAERGLTTDECDTLAGLERYFEGMLEVIARLAALGLIDRMSFGSDAGAFDTEFGHPDYSVTLARLAGLSAIDSIRVVTLNAARAIGSDDVAGSIEVGKRADMVLVRGDPLADGAVLVSPTWVMKAGKLVFGEPSGDPVA
jgi:imidazolonepropionase-like amidohydrolase